MAYKASDIVIVDGYRTPVGSFRGSLSNVPASQLGTTVIKRILKENPNLSPDQISEVILGQVLTAGCGQNPARQASVNAGLPYSVPASGVSMVCGSGLKAVVSGYQSILCGDSDVVVAGGQESMSQSVHCMRMREGCKFGHATLTDTMMTDGLTDAFHDYHMANTAENVAKQFNISREDQDTFAHQSQMKCQRARESGWFKEEITAFELKAKGKKEGTFVHSDEFPRDDCTLEGLRQLRPCFIRDGTGTVTAGNSSGINDGAAAVLLMTAGQALSLQLREPLARVVSSAQTGVSPEVMGMGPVSAVRSAVGKAGWTLDDVDLFELNEAFAAQSVAVQRELGVDPDRVNINGGSISIGHPIGASGCRILVTLLYALKRTGKSKGVAALCIGGGMGIAICVERLEFEF